MKLNLKFSGILLYLFFVSFGCQHDGPFPNLDNDYPLDDASGRSVLIDPQALWQEIGQLAPGEWKDLSQHADFGLQKQGQRKSPLLLGQLTRSEMIPEHFQPSIATESDIELQPEMDIAVFEGFTALGEEMSMVVSPEYVGGYFISKGEPIYFQSLRMTDPDADLRVVKLSTDSDYPIDQAPCPVEEMALPAPQDRAYPGEGELRSAGCRKFELMFFGDYAYFKLAQHNYNLAIFALAVSANNMAPSYKWVKTDLIIPNGSIVIKTSYEYHTSNMAVWLSNLSNWWAAFPNFKRDHVINVTGQNMHYKNNYNTVGLAYLGTVCTDWARSVSIVEWNHNGNTTPIGRIARCMVHESGHALGLNHTGCGGGSGSAGVMYYNLGSPCSSNYFNTASINQVYFHYWVAGQCMPIANCN